MNIGNILDEHSYMITRPDKYEGILHAAMIKRYLDQLVEELYEELFMRQLQVYVCVYI